MKTHITFVLAFLVLLLSACENEIPRPTYQAKPMAPLTISSFYPESVDWGEEVTLMGENFGASISDNHVTLNGTQAEVTHVQFGIVVVRIPMYLEEGDYTIRLSTPGQTTTAAKPLKIRKPGPKF